MEQCESACLKNDICQLIWDHTYTYINKPANYKFAQELRDGLEPPTKTNTSGNKTSYDSLVFGVEFFSLYCGRNFKACSVWIKVKRVKNRENGGMMTLTLAVEVSMFLF